ncbi:helix-turn-helix domain-containing protein [Vibrio algarum]|uniref:Helix-turn-helix domain-containing protein n=1 Tax=Vibrio algarum TaxID=3020714 RepID=A0ABT4YWZ8_9VIBR|nr:helix-turn-helix domain-containing protein [Vibrio sp. KJ40-1]MDB1126110.1 helix-turn-helix domain-containing protein [Vibrio sp. KJ40-1]
MGESNKIPEQAFLKGHDFTNNLKMLLGCKNLQELSSLTGVPTSTFSTWNMKNRTSFELMIRVHLAFNIPMKDISLGYQIPNGDNERLKVEENSTSYRLGNELSTLAHNKTPAILESYELKNGQLVDRHVTLFDPELLLDFNDDKLMVVKDRNQLFIIDTSCNQAVSGLYLINIDGFLSLNQIQRIPGNNIAIAFNNSTLNVSENDIAVIGKVATEVKRVLN